MKEHTDQWKNGWSNQSMQQQPDDSTHRLVAGLPVKAAAGHDVDLVADPVAVVLDVDRPMFCRSRVASNRNLDCT